MPTASTILRLRVVEGQIKLKRQIICTWLALLLHQKDFFVLFNSGALFNAEVLPSVTYYYTYTSSLLKWGIDRQDPHSSSLNYRGHIFRKGPVACLAECYNSDCQSQLKDTNN